ncbi:MAG: bifunctional phosphopantothenoylcysteine decarboxylase/phosphopantothenate--cysteine ligase CoaBC [Candidatus Levybacteria bacterium]|nr:bifunctional phosphopantothenoylcysteine decarboxylase/phosphopantothenate--cysteine ligase CoaBC [Candidatus Levybacteria bacterium]
MKKTVVLGVSSGIAAYKTLDLVRMLRKEGADVFVVMTEAATKMVDPKEFEKVSGNKVYTELFEKGFDYRDVLKVRKVGHIDLADRADVICIAPATANVIAKLAHGIADDFLTTMVLAANSPVILSPSMNVHMWSNPVTQENIVKLKKLGFIIISPERGPLACGYEGQGRLPHLEKIKEEILGQVSYSKSLAGKTVVVTAGATIERIDDVRYITNNASGKMGAAIAEECHLRGARVILLCAKNAVEPRYIMEQEVFETFEDLEKLVKKHIKNTDIFFHTAAVGDFTAEKSLRGKTKSHKALHLALKPQKKLSDQIKILNPKIKLIIFKAEWGLSEKQLHERAKKKLKESGADVVIANDVSRSDRGFEADTNEIEIVGKDKKIKKISFASKRKIAVELVEYILELF